MITVNSGADLKEVMGSAAPPCGATAPGAALALVFLKCTCKRKLPQCPQDPENIESSKKLTSGGQLVNLSPLTTHRSWEKCFVQ